MPKATGSQAARGVKPSPAKQPARKTTQDKPKDPTLREPLPGNTRGWGIAGAAVAVLGLVGAVVAGTNEGLDGVQDAPLGEVGAIIAQHATWVQAAGALLAIGGIGFAILAAAQREMRCGAAGNLMAWAGGLVAAVWVLSGMFLAVSSDLASEWGHGPGAKAAFATANIIAGAPMALVMATYTGASACVYGRHGQRVFLVLAALAVLVFLTLTLTEVNEIRQAAGAVPVATALWAIIAALGLAFYKGRPINGR